MSSLPRSSVQYQQSDKAKNSVIGIKNAVRVLQLETKFAT